MLPAPASAEDWLQWGGPKGDFTVAATGLAETWPAGGPKSLWKRPLGDGYSAILCKGDRLFTAYRDGGNDVVIALEARTGKTIWEHKVPFELWPDMTKEFGLGPNATPLIVDDRIMAISISGQMRCLDLDTGAVKWQHDLPATFGRRKRVEEYGYSGNPLPYRGTVIVQVGGDEHGVVAFHVNDGSVTWKSGAFGVSYAPPTITKLLGEDHYVFFTPEGVAGLDPSTGAMLWHSDIPFNNGNHLTPVVRCDDQHLWVASQFITGGARLLKITKDEGRFKATEVWHEKKLMASHWTSIRLDDYVYGCTGNNEVSFLTAFAWKTGKIAWRERGHHKAQCLYADGKLLFLDEEGELTIAKVSPEKLQVLDSAQITESVSWTVPTLVGTRLFVRDRKNIMAMELGKSDGE